MNNNGEMDATELATAVKTQQEQQEEWMTRHPEMGKVWGPFVAEHMKDYIAMWEKADNDGDLETGNLSELFDFCTQIAIFHHIHFLI